MLIFHYLKFNIERIVQGLTDTFHKMVTLLIYDYDETTHFVLMENN